MDSLGFWLLFAVISMKTVLISGQCDQRLLGGTMMCCAGRNSNCYVRVSAKAKGSSSRRVCYCDEYCKMTGDCCDDFDKIKDSCRGKQNDFL